MELVVGSSASRTLLSLCLLLILLVLLQILYIQRSLLLNSFEMAKLPCANGSVHNVPAEPKDSNVDDVVLLDYKHRSLDVLKGLNLRGFFRFLDSKCDAEFVEWLQAVGLLHSKRVCPSCGELMKFYKQDPRGNGKMVFLWRGMKMLTRPDALYWLWKHVCEVFVCVDGEITIRQVFDCGWEYDVFEESLYNPKQLTIQLLNNKANLSKQTKQESHHPPNYLIIGVRKGGTRALLQTIALHPDVKVAKKEVHFFDRDQKYNLGKQWYSQQMPPSTPQQVVIEKTPAYFTSPKAPARVHSLNAQMKLILIVRDPVVRLISDFTQVYYNKLELNKTQVDFKKAVLQANSSSLNYAYKPVRNSLYNVHLARWLEYFPMSQVLVLDGDNFIRHPLKQVRLTEKFLNLEPKIRDDQLVFNERKGFYCFRKKQKRVARCLGQTKGRVQVPVDNKFQRLLARQFGPHNQRFFAQINKSFPLWGT